MKVNHHRVKEVDGLCSRCRFNRAAAEKVGTVEGGWYIVGQRGVWSEDTGYRYDMHCVDCGRHRCTTLVKAKRKLCECQRMRRKEAGERRREGMAKAADREVLIDAKTPYEEDDACWYVVHCHPEGLTMDRVGELMGVSRQRVEQIESAALKKLAKIDARWFELRELHWHVANRMGDNV